MPIFNKWIFISFLFLFLKTSVLQAQQLPLFSQYFQNPFLYNPAEAGLEKGLSSFLIYRNQWMGFSGSPQTYALSLNSSIKDLNMGIGLNLMNDRTGILNNLNGAFAYAFHAQLTENQVLSLGISARFSQFSLDVNQIRIQDPDDLIFLNNINNSTRFDADFGIKYRLKRFELSLSLPNLYGRRLLKSEANKNLYFNYEPHLFASTSYQFQLNENFSLKPLIMYRAIEAIDGQFDFNLILDFKEKIWIAAAYRSEYAITGAMGFRINKKINFAYSYDYGITDLSGFHNGSHEITLGMRIKQKSKKEKIILPVSDSIPTQIFVNQVDTASKIEKDSLESSKTFEEEKPFVSDSVIYIVPKAQAENIQIKRAKIYNNYVVVSSQENRAEAQNIVHWLRQNGYENAGFFQASYNQQYYVFVAENILLEEAQNYQKQVPFFTWIYTPIDMAGHLQNEIETDLEQKFEIQKQAKEPLNGIYERTTEQIEQLNQIEKNVLYEIIIGTFYNLANAKKEQKRLQKLGYESKIIQQKTTQKYYLINQEFDSKAQAEAYKETLRNTHIKDAWIRTVKLN